MVEVYNKIIVVSLCDKFSIKVGKTLSHDLDMMFCSTRDLGEYELIDKDKLKQTTSKEYYDLRERKVIKHIASFEDVVVSISYDYLIHHVNILKKNSLVVFLDLPIDYVEQNGNIVDVIDFENRIKNLKDIATLSIDIESDDVNLVCDQIITELGGIL
ncbi:MAG: hypothetical protein K2K31_00500 [Clostridia bacterium]|nr:hypothetical protein [Clostridia bacterium]